MTKVKVNLQRIADMSYYELSAVWDSYWESDAELGESYDRVPDYIQRIGDEMDARTRCYSNSLKDTVTQ